MYRFASVTSFNCRLVGELRVGILVCAVVVDVAVERVNRVGVVDLVGVEGVECMLM